MNIDRTKLAALLEEYGGSLKSFMTLRADAYEQQLAGQSLERLEQLYSELFKPGQTLEKAREHCPPWPPGTARKGELPSVTTLGNIAERFNTERALNGIGAVAAFLNNLRASVKKTALGDNDQVVEALVAIAGQEALKAKLDGTPVSAQLEVVDRLQYQQRTKLKGKEVETREKAINLLLKKYEDERVQSKAVLGDAKLSPEQKQERMREILGMT